jgi:hypothetical protein
MVLSHSYCVSKSDADNKQVFHIHCNNTHLRVNNNNLVTTSGALDVTHGQIGELYTDTLHVGEIGDIATALTSFNTNSNQNYDRLIAVESGLNDKWAIGDDLSTTNFRCSSADVSGNIACSNTVTAGQFLASGYSTIGGLTCGPLTSGGIMASGSIQALGSITGTSLHTVGALACGNVSCGTVLCDALSSGGGIHGTSLNVGSGAITGGTVSCGAISSSGNIGGTALNVGSGTITAGAVSGSTGTFTGALNSVGHNNGSGGITNAGPIACTSISASSGVNCAAINMNNGDILNGANFACTSLHCGDSITALGTVTGQFITATGFIRGSGHIIANNSLVLNSSGNTYFREIVGGDINSYTDIGVLSKMQGICIYNNNVYGSNGLIQVLGFSATGTYSKSWQLFLNPTTTGTNNLHFATANNSTPSCFMRPTSANTQLNFTGQHACLGETHLYTDFNPFGLIVEANGDHSIVDSNEIILNGSDAITVDEALPVLKLCTTRQSKAVFGVISSVENENVLETGREYTKGNFTSVQKAEDRRIFVNSVGEGGVWVTNRNGDIEVGDYIQSSDIAGMGELQNSPSLYNYTVAKSTTHCTFELGVYRCYQVIQEELSYRVAFIAVTYHCG